MFLGGIAMLILGFMTAKKNLHSFLPPLTALCGLAIFLLSVLLFLVPNFFMEG
jgi:hypothetical protein